MIEAVAGMVRGGARKVIGFYKKERESFECLEALVSLNCSPRTILDLSDLAKSPPLVDTSPLAPRRELEISEISMGSEIPILLTDIKEPFRSPDSKSPFGYNSSSSLSTKIRNHYWLSRTL
jgi:hypothetical protein